MELTIYWTNFAKNELKYIFDYHKNKVSLKIAKKITRQIVGSTIILSSYPEIGVIEDLLIEKPQNFRYLVNSNYKIIYWINQQRKRIEIVDVFDTRQNPEKISRNK